MISSVMPAKAGIQDQTVEKAPCVYILASQKNETLYVGVTSDIVKRCWEHKKNLVDGFTKRYDIHNLVYYELHETLTDAIQREKQTKKWRRAWKPSLIEEQNPTWRDLWNEIV